MGVIKSTSVITGVIPFTELYERLMNLGRIDSPNNTDFAKGIVNDVYTRTLTRAEDWDVLVTDGNLSMIPTVVTGTVAVTVGSTTVTGTGTTFTAAMTSEAGYKIRFLQNRDIYKFDFVSATVGTISPALSGPTTITAGTFEIFKDEYDLPSDFDRFLKNGSVYVNSGGRLQDTLKEVPRDMFREDFEATRRDPIRRVIRTRVNATTSRRMLRVNPWPKEAYNYPFEYIKKLTPMSEYTTGTVTVTNGSTTVTGSETFFTANVSAGDYFRADGNGIAESSKWYKVASVTTNTTLVLEVVYGEATEALLEYTASGFPSAFPTEFHEFLLYDGLLTVAGEQGDVNVQGFAARRIVILQDLKKNFKARRTNTQFRVGDDGIRSGNYDRDDDVSYRR